MSRARAEKTRTNLYKVDRVRPNRVLREAVQRWLNENADSAEKLQKAGIKYGYIASIISPTGLDEKILWPFAEDLEKLTGIDIRHCLFAGAKLNLWEDNDRMPELASYDQMLTRLERCYAEYSPKKELARILEISEPSMISKWVAGRKRIATHMIERILKLLLRLDHPEVCRELYPEELEVAEPHKEGISEKTVRLAINGFFGSLTGQIALLRSLISETAYKPVLGDQAKALSAALGVLHGFGVDERAMRKLARHEPLSVSDIELLGKAFGTTIVGKEKS